MFTFFKSTSESHFSGQIRPHLQRLYHHAYRLTNSPDDAEDLVQDLLLRLYEKKIDLENIEKPVHWLIRSLHNQFIDNYRKKSRLPVDDKEIKSDEIIDSMGDEERSPHQLHEQVHTSQRLKSAINTLNPDQQSLIALHDIEGYSLTELSQILDSPVGTLKSRLHRARHKLREHLFSENEELMEPFDKNKRVTG